MKRLLLAGASLAALITAAAPAAAETIAINYTGAIVDVPIVAAGEYKVTAFGAQGGSSHGSGGLGAEVIGYFTFSAGQRLQIAVGGKGADGWSDGAGGGGGGGTFVIDPSTNQPLVIAGGGGGGGTHVGGGDAGAGVQGIGGQTTKDGSDGYGWHAGGGAEATARGAMAPANTMGVAGVAALGAAAAAASNQTASATAAGSWGSTAAPGATSWGTSAPAEALAAVGAAEPAAFLIAWITTLAAAGAAATVAAAGASAAIVFTITAAAGRRRLVRRGGASGPGRQRARGQRLRPHHRSFRVGAACAGTVDLGDDGGRLHGAGSRRAAPPLEDKHNMNRAPLGPSEGGNE